jgi:hypothetical protein
VWPRKDSRKPRPLRRVALPLGIVGWLLASAIGGQAPACAASPAHPDQQRAPMAAFDLVLSNPQAAVFDLRLPDHAQAGLFQNSHDLLLIALGELRLSLVRASGEGEAVSLAAGDVRWLPRYRFKSLLNESGAEVRAVMVDMKSDAGTRCECSGDVERTVCGCERRHLPALWAFATGPVTIAGTTLARAWSSWGPTARGDTLLVAITRVDLREPEPGAKVIQLKPGEAYWLARGTHRLINAAAAPARFVSVEF